MQHEGDPLGRSERLEYHEQGQTHRFAQQRFVLGVDLVLEARGPFGNPRADGLLAPRLA